MEYTDSSIITQLYTFNKPWSLPAAAASPERSELLGWYIDYKEKKHEELSEVASNPPLMSVPPSILRAAASLIQSYRLPDRGAAVEGEVWLRRRLRQCRERRPRNRRSGGR